MVVRGNDAASRGLRLHLACLAALAGCSGSRSFGRGVSLDRFETEARLEAELRDETFEGGTSVSTDETILRENIEFDFDGNVYHPKLMTFGGVLDLGLEQREIDQDGAPATIRSNDDNNRYDLNATLLKDHPYTARLFAQRTQVRIRQSFFPTNDAVVTRNGALLMAKEWIIPSQLEYANYYYEGESGDTRRERRDSLNLTGSRSTDNVNVYYTVFSQEVDSDLAGGRYDDFQAVGGGTLRFGHDLRSSVSVDGQQRKQTGDVENENTNVSGRATVALTDAVDSRSGVSVGSSEFGGQQATETDRTDAFTELEHRLFDSLTTTVRADYMEQTIGGAGELERVGGLARVAYRKEVPFGRLNLDYQLGKSRQDETGRFGANVTVPDEPHVVVPGNPVFLVNPNVDNANILVTDATGSIVYTTPADYVADLVGVRTRLTFPVGSQIVAGQTILVTYTFASSFDRVFDTDSQFVGMELGFGEVLTLDAHWSELDQDLVSGASDSTLDHATEIGFGVRAKVAGQDFTLEYLDRDSQLTPYARTSAAWHTWKQFTDALSCSASVSGWETEFKDENDRERGVAGLFNLNWRPDEFLSLELRAELRRSELRTEDGTGAYLQGLLRYQFRKTQLELSLLSAREEWEFSSDRDVLRAMLTVIRRF